MIKIKESKEDNVHRGSCLCGEIRYEIEGELGNFGYCHCRSCRKASGAPHGANAPADRETVRFADRSGTLREYESSPGKFRAFCSNCGSALYARLTASPEILRIRLGSLDTPFEEKAKAHTWVSDKADWEDINDDLPQFAEWASKDVLDQKGTRQK